MKSKFRQLNADEKRQLLNYKLIKKTGPHKMTGRICSWVYCRRCKVIAFKNKATRRHFKKKCVAWE